MKYLLLIVCSFLLFGFVQFKPNTKIRVGDKAELYDAISRVNPGEEIILANGEWNDVEIKLIRSGKEGALITIRAETAGKVFIQGNSNIQLGGDYIVVDGLYFLNGSSPSRSVINFAVKDKVANHCRLTNCVIEDFNKSQRNQSDLWVLFKGKNNQMDHCYLTGKSNRGPTVRVDLEGNQNINNYHKIINNHFGPRPPKGGPSAETIQIGNSYTSMCPSYTLVANNLFEECNGEVEVISSKTNFNEFRNNVFYKSEGSLVTRHGNYCTVDGNYFIGDESSTNVGGIRLIGTGHTVTNNYFYNLRGKEFRAPLAVMNGIKKSPLNRYIQVTDVTVAYNSWVNCEEPLQFGVGSNISQKDVLPASEIRSEVPIRTIVANNLIANTKGDKMPIVAHDKLDGIQFENNVISNQGVAFEDIEGIKAASVDLKELSKYVWAPGSALPSDDMFVGFGFEEFENDIFGQSRQEQNAVGAIAGIPNSEPNIFEKSNFGTDWYAKSRKIRKPVKHSLLAGESLTALINMAGDGDIIELASGKYKITAPLKIDKELTIECKGRAILKYSGPAESPLFEMNPYGNLFLSNLDLEGGDTQYAFASLKENMSSLYNLTLDNCTVSNFAFILKAYKFSMSEDIKLVNSTFRDCAKGLELSEETDDKGDYNAENILIDNCTFDGIESNVLDYYRGGYDESTVGGNLVVTNSTFTNSGAKEKNGTLLNTYGIINVDISNNTFRNNEVKLIAQLWGAKNNKHANNKIVKSGEIVVEENLKLKTFY